MKRKTPLRRTKLKPVSEKRRKDMATYKILRDEHMRKNPMCQGWLMLNNFMSEEIREIQEIAFICLWQGMDVPPIPARKNKHMELLGLPQWCPRSFDLHHSHGRGKNYIKTEYFMALARSTHDWCHRNAYLARKCGLLA